MKQSHYLSMDIGYVFILILGFFFNFLLWDKLIFLFTPFQSVVHRPRKPHQVSEVTSAGEPRHLCHVVMLLHEDEYEPLEHVTVKNKSKQVSYKIMPLTVSIHLLDTLKLKRNLNIVFSVILNCHDNISFNVVMCILKSENNCSHWLQNENIEVPLCPKKKEKKMVAIFKQWHYIALTRNVSTLILLSFHIEKRFQRLMPLFIFAIKICIAVTAGSCESPWTLTSYLFINKSTWLSRLVWVFTVVCNYQLQLLLMFHF